MQESILNTYGMLSLNTYGKLLFLAGSSYYHNGIVIGLVQMEQQGVIELEWKKADIPDKWIDPTAKKTLEPVEQVWIHKRKELTADLEEFRFLYKWLPDGQAMNLIDLVEIDYRYEINCDATTMQSVIEQGLLERHLAYQSEKKRFLREPKLVISADSNRVHETAETLRESLNRENVIPEDKFIVCYLAKNERMLPKMFDKMVAQIMYQKIEKLCDMDIYKNSTFMRLIELVEFLEENVFLSFTLDN